MKACINKTGNMQRRKEAYRWAGERCRGRRSATYFAGGRRARMELTANNSDERRVSEESGGAWMAARVMDRVEESGWWRANPSARSRFYSLH